MIEMAMVFSRRGELIHWHAPRGSSRAHIPDSRELWDILWENREDLGGVAHSHPMSVNSAPSPTDITTFRAIEDGLGQFLVWPVVTPHDAKYWVRAGDGYYYNRGMLAALPLMNREERNGWISMLHELLRKSHQGEENG